MGRGISPVVKSSKKYGEGSTNYTERKIFINKRKIGVNLFFF